MTGVLLACVAAWPGCSSRSQAPVAVSVAGGSSASPPSAMSPEGQRAGAGGAAGAPDAPQRGIAGAAGRADAAGAFAAAGAGGAAGAAAGSGGAAGGIGVAGSGATAGAIAEAGSGGAAGSGGSSAAGSSAAPTPTLPSGALARRFADAVLTRWPDPAAIASNNPTWEYNHGIVLRGLVQVYLRSSDARYLSYVRRFVDQSVRADGRLDIPAAHSFDNLQPSVLLPLLFERTGEAKYKTAADAVRARYDAIPRNAHRGFWHKQQYPNQMWLDSAYMGLPFLARYAAVFGGCDEFCYDTVAEQMMLMADHLRDPNSGLLYHAWDDSPRGQKASWADAESGRSPAVWGRGLGWYAMALVDLLADLPAAHPQRKPMLDVFGALAAGLAQTQDPETGLWYQVVDQGSRADNWLESSGSGMFVYAIKVGTDRGYIDSKYRALADKGYQGLMGQVSMDGGGLPTIRGAVRGMGVQDNYAAYVDQMTLSNSPHGLCAILLASSEMDLR